MLKRIVKSFFIVSLFIVFIPVVKDIKIKEKVDKIILQKEKSIYRGFIYIPRFNFKSVIKKDKSALDENLVGMTNFSDEIGESNIVLAGHNNKYVFNKIYYLEKGDEIIISDFKTDYKYTVTKTKYIEVDNYDALNNPNSLTLITCTNNNQERYIVIAKRE